MATKKKPQTEEKVESKETIEGVKKVAEIEEKVASDDFFTRKLKAINKVSNPAKARRYSKWLFNSKRGIK